MHSERKRMKCESCDKEFEGEKALKRHIRIAHEGLRVPCKQCDKRFTSNQSRNRHFMVIHETKKIELKWTIVIKPFPKRMDYCHIEI